MELPVSGVQRAGIAARRLTVLERPLRRSLIDHVEFAIVLVAAHHQPVILDRNDDRHHIEQAADLGTRHARSFVPVG